MTPEVCKAKAQEFFDNCERFGLVRAVQIDVLALVIEQAYCRGMIDQNAEQIAQLRAAFPSVTLDAPIR